MQNAASFYKKVSLRISVSHKQTFLPVERHFKVTAWKLSKQWRTLQLLLLNVTVATTKNNILSLKSVEKPESSVLYLFLLNLKGRQNQVFKLFFGTTHMSENTMEHSFWFFHTESRSHERYIKTTNPKQSRTYHRNGDHSEIHMVNKWTRWIHISENDSNGPWTSESICRT